MPGTDGCLTTSPEFEAFLARLYVDRDFRARFLLNPRAEANQAGLSEEETLTLEGIDRCGLELAAGSYDAKRSRHKRRTGWLRRLLHR